ncbi:MAG TPA: hypothetical protein VHV83_03360 [Armatimonadota bacterium]|nr:hypothetical protein [Armatimonadota bacterium]
MPTIELVAIDCRAIPDLPSYQSFAYRVDTQLESDRALFQPVFEALNGIMIHLANKDFEGDDNGPWFAGAIMDWTQTGSHCKQVLIFLPETRDEIIDLMQRLLCASPQHRITFSTDYQFGGERRICSEITLADFVNLHDQRSLRYNELYFIRSS